MGLSNSDELIEKLIAMNKLSTTGIQEFEADLSSKCFDGLYVEECPGGANIRPDA